MNLLELLKLRNHVSDHLLLDMVELSILLPSLPAKIKTKQLMDFWHCSQPTVSRRLVRLWELELIDYRRGSRGSYVIRRIGLR